MTIGLVSNPISYMSNFLENFYTYLPNEQLSMLSNVRFTRVSLKKALEQIPDPINQVLFKIFCIGLLLTALKLLVVAPIYYQDPILLVILITSLISCATFYIFLLIQPNTLKRLTKFALALFALYVGMVIYISPDSINFVSIQHIFIIIMWAFYGLNRRWGVTYSTIFILFITSFLCYHKNALPEFHLFPLSFPFYTSFTIITLNFILAAIIHFYYHKALITSVQEKTQLNDRLNKLLDAKTNFLSTMSHELRTPLNSVIGMANLLVDNNQDKDQKENLDNLRFSAESLLFLINDILDFNKIDSKKMELESIPFNLHHLLENIRKGMSTKANEKKIYCNLETAPELSAINVVGDPARLSQIIYNLMGNAIKFTEKGGAHLHAKLLDKTDGAITIRFSVADTGMGIEPNQQQLIFEPFTQASNHISTKFGGVGLGLAIVKHLVGLHGAVIKLQSTPDKGSLFYFDIKYPIYLEQRHGYINPNTERAITTRSLQGLRVLLAEDNPMSILFMEKLLAKWDVELDIGKNGKETIDKLEQRPYDVVLMDLHMPVMDGIAAAQHIRNMNDPAKSNIHIVALTASVSDDIIANIRELGFDDYLGKPFRPNDLHRKLEKVLNK